MEILGLVSAILLALLLVALFHTLFMKRDKIPYYRPIRDKFKKKKIELPEEPLQRMFVAVRRNPMGRGKMMALDEEQYEKEKAETLVRFDQLIKQWSAVAVFKWGFHGSEYGLPSSLPEEGWMLFACFVVADHESYRYCYEIMQTKPFLALQNQFDIRLLYGERMDSLPHNANELFRRAFSR